MFVIDHPVALADREIRIALGNLPPRAEVSVTATQDFPSGSRWRARASYRSDAQGRIDLTRDAPLHGSYAGV